MCHVSTVQFLDLVCSSDCHPQGLENRILVIGDRKRLRVRTEQVPHMLQYTFEQ